MARHDRCVPPLRNLARGATGRDAIEDHGLRDEVLPFEDRRLRGDRRRVGRVGSGLLLGRVRQRCLVASTG